MFEYLSARHYHGNNADYCYCSGELPAVALRLLADSMAVGHRAITSRNFTCIVSILLVPFLVLACRLPFQHTLYSRALLLHYFRVCASHCRRGTGVVPELHTHPFYLKVVIYQRLSITLRRLDFVPGTHPSAVHLRLALCRSPDGATRQAQDTHHDGDSDWHH